MTPQNIIPKEKNEAVVRALRETFGVTEMSDIQRMTKGQTSALVLRVMVRDRAYLMRIIMRTHPMLGPERHFGCMRAAADAGLAPRVWYASVEDGISITDFLEEVPFPANEALRRMPAVLRELHTLPPFPPAPNHLNTTCLFLVNEGPALDGFLAKWPAGEILDCRAELAAVYRPDDMVSCHNDLFKPDNVLFDGERVWLVDWEAAFLNDPYVDLAVVANLLVSDEDSERVFLDRYFGQPATDYQRARFFLMRQLTHLFYAMAFLKPAEMDGEAPEFASFQRRMWTGDANIVGNEAKLLYGLVHLEELRRNMRGPRYREALKMLRDIH